MSSSHIPLENFIALFLVAAAILIFAGRELVCWYWKQNQIVKLLTEVRDELRKRPNTDIPKLDSPNGDQ